MTEETPAKVFSLLGVALTSMFFLFAVTVTNANFSQTERPFPTVFEPQNVMAVLDTASNAYAKFVEANLTEPAVNSYAILQYNVNYIIDEASPSILAYTGLTSLADVSAPSLQVAQPQVAHSIALRATLSGAEQVAGAYTEAVPKQKNTSDSGFSMDGLYSLLMLR